MQKIKKQTVAVLGAGNFGTAMAHVLSENGHIVQLWNWEGDHTPLKQIEKGRENKKYLKGVKLSKNVVPRYKIASALEGASIVFFAIPTSVLEHTVSFAAKNIKEHAILVDLSKGVHPHTLQIMTRVIAKHVRISLKKNVVSISGPSIAEQMVRREYTAMNIASKNKSAIKKVMDAVCNDYVTLVPTVDVIGVEVGGSFKNVYAIAMGMCDAMGFPMNTKAALITRTLGEIADLTAAMGGKRKTIYGLAGLGDLLGTALCKESRNWQFGYHLGKGIDSETALKKVGSTVEGKDASWSLVRLGKKHKLDLPLATAIYQCVYGKKKCGKLINKFVQPMV